MARSVRKTLGRIAAGGLALLLAAAPPARAKDKDTADLKARLDKLEQLTQKLEEQNQKLARQNEQLEKQNQQLQKPRAESAGPAAGAAAAPGDTLDRQTVQDIVSSYLKTEEEKKQQAEEEKKHHAQEAGSEVGKDLKMNVTWRDGVLFETADKAFKFTVGGRVDFDSSWFSSSRDLSNSIGQFNNFTDPNLGLTDGADFRRARLRFQGTLWEVMEFNTEVDFANFIDLRRRTLGVPASPAPASFPGTPPLVDFDPAVGTRITDAWLGINEIPVLGTFRAGHMKEWITFSNATSGRYLTFMERPLQFDAFNNDFQFSDGFSLQNNFLNQRAYWWVGMFRNNSNVTAFDVQDGDYAYDARLTLLPVWLDDGNVWVHVGADYSYRNLHADQVRFRGRPLVFSGESFQVPNVVNTGTIFSKDHEQIANLEYASAFGPFTLTSEYTAAFVDNTYTGGLPLPNGKLPKGVVAHGDYFAQGWYVEALYFLTGEHRGYRREQPSYDRIRPSTNFFLVRGPHHPLFGQGAWEVGVRYDLLDLTNHGINGGTTHAVTLGLNWHLNPNMKVQWNYVWMDRDFEPINVTDRRPGELDAFGMRFHWDF